MNKKIYMYFIITCLSNFPQPSLSDEILPDAQLTISLDVVRITCDINNGLIINLILVFLQNHMLNLKLLKKVH